MRITKTLIRKVIKLAIYGVMICTLSLILVIGMSLPTNEVILESCQSKENQWEASSRFYCLKVIKKNRDWEHFFFRWGTRWNYELELFPIQSGRGYSVKFSFSPSLGDDKEKYIQQSVIQWEKNGVTLITLSGNRLFLKSP